MTGLLRAVLCSDYAEARRLLGEGASIEEIDTEGRTPLMHAVIEGNAEMVHFLIESGARVNASDKNGFTALHFAAQDFQLDAARQLIAAGTKIDAVDNYGNTPLWRAVFNSRNRGEMIQLLLNAGADRSVKNSSGVSPRDLAQTIGNYDVRQFLT